MKIIYCSAICLASFLGATSCSLFKTSTTASQPQLPVSTTSEVALDLKSIPEIINGDWFITRAGNMDLASEGSNMPTMGFAAIAGKAGNVVNYYAYDGCNYNSGSYTFGTDGSVRRMGEPISTMKFCGDSPYEMAVITGINSVTHYSVTHEADSYELYFKNQTGDTLLTLRKSNIDFINGAWTASLIGGESVPESADIKLVIDVACKTIHGIAGCNTINGKINIDNNSGNAIGFSDIISTRMTCPDIDTESTLLTALATIVAVRPGSTSREAVLLNALGEEAVVLTRIDTK